MATQRFFIAPLNSGLVRNVRPWLIPDDAFETLNNAYIYRGRVRKRFGSVFMDTTREEAFQQLGSRLRIKLGTGNATYTVPGDASIPAANRIQIGQMVSIDNAIYTIYQLGAAWTATYNTGGAGTVEIDSVNGKIRVTTAPASDVYWYPAYPVMGLITFEDGPINEEPVYAFDTQFAYNYVNTGWERLAGGAETWTGDNSEFFWGTTYRGDAAGSNIFYVTNFVPFDRIRYRSGGTWTKLEATIQLPTTNPPDPATLPQILLETARIIIPFKDRLVLLNTYENVGGTGGNYDGTSTHFPNRARWCQNGSPLDAQAWRQPTQLYGRGSFIDAPTSEHIITAEIIRDRLIVFFERSTWELVYTGNQELPFVWQTLNVELGAESTFSVVPFDKHTLTVGNVGIHACNGANVERIDNKIPDEVFEIHNQNEGVFRVHGIRDFGTELVYWTFPSANEDTTFPDRILVYNYKNGSWAINDDSFTTFGRYQRQQSATWASSTEQWQQNNETWSAGQLQAQYPDIIAGNQEGFVVIINRGFDRNAPTLMITNLTIAGDTVTITAINHNLKTYVNPDLQTPQYVLIESTVGINNINGGIFPVASIVDANTFTIKDEDGDITGTYAGGGTVARVSTIDILTKQYNFFTKTGQNVAVNKVDFLVDKEENGQITVDYFPSFTTHSLVQAGETSQSILGNNILETSPYATEPLEALQSQLWHPIYFQMEGETFQMRFYWTRAQNTNANIALSDFQLHAMIIYAEPGSSRLQ